MVKTIQIKIFGLEFQSIFLWAAFSGGINQMHPASKDLM